jgi:hypothetical protein
LTIMAALLPISSRDWRAAACATVLMYATAVVGVPILHASLEVSHSTAAFESEHAADCPMFHGGPLCEAVGSLFVSEPARAPRGQGGRRVERDLRRDAPVQPAPAPAPATADARAPPLG